jgi:uncharacterized protein
MPIFETIVLFLSGLGAGVMTGLIGASAVTFMAGILIVLLGYGAYHAIGISLITDVSASLVSAHLYRKAKNIDVKRGLIIGLLALVFAFLGSFLARLIPDVALTDGLGIIILLTGLSFIRNPLKREENKFVKYFNNKKTIGSILIGIFVGLFCGVFGVGGGITILIALVFILGYPIKMAVGTSVLIMAFISLSGGVGHFIGREFPWITIIITSVGGIIGAIFASNYANKTSEEKMFRITGILLILIALAVIFKKFFYLYGFSI